MSISIQGHNLDLTPALENHLNEKAQKLYTHHDEIIVSIDFIMKIDNLEKICEATIHLKGHGNYHLTAKCTDMYSAQTKLIAMLDRKCEKHKAQLKNKHAGQGSTST